MVEKLRKFIDKILTALHLIKYKEIILYLIVGGGTTVVDWVIFTVFALFVPPVGGEFVQKISPNILAYSIAWLGAVIFAYVLSRLFVFEQTGEKIIPQFFKFFVSRIMTLVLSIVGDILLSGLLKMNPFIAKAIISVAVIIINYITGKFLVFRKKKKADAEAAKQDETESEDGQS
ncbi:MAG: GtrA family protein [Clostridia bacterium]|nr:GtrA family protein [Clostridia bacterium]